MILEISECCGGEMVDVHHQQRRLRPELLFSSGQNLKYWF